MVGTFKADYSGKVVFVTGAGSGLSRETAKAFAAAGGTLVAADIDGDGARATIAAVKDAGGDGIAYDLDVTSRASVEDVIGDVVKRFGRLDCVFNGAGLGSRIGGTILDYEDEHWDQVMDVNLRGMFFCLRAQIRQMVAQGGGAIVNVASIGGERATPKAPAYIASKHGVIGLTRAVAIDHAVQNVRINAICPGFIGGTRMMDDFIDKDPEVRTAHMNTTIPIGRMGRGSDIAGVALWLCSDAAAYLVGETIFVDGGLRAK
jgi:NAD(P)-dependent dehydrogenase (short-subunit alcohol dehydrogenase family)